MIESLKTLKIRIRSVGNMQKITQAMQMVSAVKISRVKNILYKMRPYFEKLDASIINIVGSADLPVHPLLMPRETIKTVALCIITSDAGLCGTYNTSVVRLAENFIKDTGIQRVKLVTIGREGYNHFKRQAVNIAKTHLEIRSKYSREMSQKISDELVEMYVSGEVDEVYVAYTHFETTLRHRPILEKFLTIGLDGTNKTDVRYIAEPNINEVLDELITKYISEKMRVILLNSFVSEHSARMIAMKAATDNAKDLINTLTLMRNKARQAAITKEVLEIASSAEALKG